MVLYFQSAIYHNKCKLSDLISAYFIIYIDRLNNIFLMIQIKILIKKSNNLHSLIGNIVYAAFGMILFMSMIRMLDKELYGQWVIIVTAISFLDILRLGLAGTGAIRAISSTTGVEQSRNIGASYHLSIYTTLFFSLIFLPIYFIIHDYFSESYYLLILIYYPFLAFANLAHNQATTYSQGIVNFKRVLIIRSSVGFFNLVFIWLYVYFFDENLGGLVIAYGLSDIVVSVFVIIKKWDGFKFLKYRHKASIIDLLNFGKYSSANNIVSNLLRSADTIIISLSPFMGASAVAVYAIPLKFIEMIEIPLRSFTATAYPKLSSAFIESKDMFNKTLIQYLSYSMLMVLPILIIIPLFSDIILQFFGGSRYEDSLLLQKSILYITTFYIIALPHDRFSGIALLAFNKPKLNFYKVVLMLLCNIIFDIIAVFVFKSLVLVAVASVIFTVLGIFIGWKYIYKYSGLTFKDSLISIYNTGICLFKSIFKTISKKDENLNLLEE